MDQISKIRPRLRQDVVFLETHEGAYVRSADVAFMMKGSSAYRWLSSLAPYMTGEHSVEELVDGLEQAQAETVNRLVSTLLERGFVRDAREDGAAALPPEVATRFARQVSFIDHFATESHKRFAAFRATRVLLSGDGVLATAAATGLLVNGLAELAVALGPAGLAQVADVARQVAGGGTEATVTHVRDPDPEAAAGYDVLVHCSETGDLAALLAASRAAAGAGAAFLPAYALDGRVFVGPLVERGSTAGLDSALLRLSDNDVGRHLWREVAMGTAAGDVRGALPTLVARMVGSLAALEVFKHRTGALLPESAGAVVVQDSETLESRREILLPHPAVLDGRDPLPDRLGGGDGEEPSDEQTYERVSALVNPHVGAFRLFTDDEIRQIPVKVGRLDTPVLESEATAGGRVVGFSSEHVMSARLAALFRATQAYALQTAAAFGRGLSEAPAAQDAPRVQPAALTTWIGGSAPFEPDRWFAGRSLVSQDVLALPVEAVLARPATRARGVYEPSYAGVGVAPTPLAAVGAGLDSALAHDRLRRLLRGEAALVPLDLADLIGGEGELRLCARSLATLSDEVWLAEVVASGGIHVAVGRATGGERTVVASGWGRRADDAVADCLLGLAGRLQCLADGVELPGAGAMDLVDLTLHADLRTAGPGASRRAEGAGSTDDLLGAAAALGLDPVVVDLTPPDLATHAALTVVRVLLAPSPDATPAA